MEQCASQDPSSYSLYFDLNIWFSGPKIKSYRDFRETGPWPVARARWAPKHFCQLIPVINKMADTVPSAGYPKFSLTDSRFDQVSKVIFPKKHDLSYIVKRILVFLKKSVASRPV